MAKNEDWWINDPREIFWCEITDRNDLGADLKCPQTDDRGLSPWSYNLIKQVLPGDIVFHYSTRKKGFVGASVAGAPLQERQIVWVPHSPGHNKEEAKLRPGWWLPLHEYIQLSSMVLLNNLREPENQSWIKYWIQQKQLQVQGPLRLPFQLYPEKIRATQGYLAKMPMDFVNHWPQLVAVVERLSSSSENLSASTDFNNPDFSNPKINLSFRPKNDSDYVAFIKGGTQHRSRSHETLVRRVGEYLRKFGASVITPHPIDLQMLAPYSVIFEMKIGDRRSPGLLIREAVGQLFEYRYFLKLSDAFGCIVLGRDPGSALVAYVEDHLKLGITWFISNEMHFGPKTAQIMPLIGKR